jgi:tight adherence protein B
MTPVFLFLIILVFTFLVALYFLRPTKTETAVKQQLESIQEERGDENRGITILRPERYSSNQEFGATVRQIPGAIKTLDLITQAGLEWTVASVMGTSLFATAAIAWIASMFLPGVLLPLLCGIIAGSGPYVYLLIMREQRFRRCDQLLPEAIDLMARALRAGHALPVVLEMVSSEIGEPVGPEFRRLHEEQALGLPLRDATMNLVSRLPREDVRFLVSAMLLQKETGGNLAAILDRTAALARERTRLRGQLRVYTAQGRLTGWILCLMPFILFGMFSLLNWQLEQLLLTEHVGRVLVYFGLSLMVLGILSIRKIIDIKV